MTWFKLDDQFPHHPKVLRAGPEAAWLFVAAGCYSASHLTDGLIPKCALATITAQKNAQRLADTLVRVGLWEELDDDYVIHDYLAYNPSREEVEADRQRRRDAGAKGARRRWDGARDGTGDSTCHDTCNDTPHDVPIAIGNAPDPSRPKEKENSRRKRRPPVDYAPTDSQCDYAKQHGLDLERERGHWLDWCEAHGRTYSNVTAGFSTWLRQAVQFGRGGLPVGDPVPVREPGLVLPPARVEVCPVCESSLLACSC